MKYLLQQITLGLLLTATLVSADDGGTVSPFSFGIGARDLSLGGAAIAESDFATAPHWNPSALASAEQYTLTGFHSTLYDSDIAYQYLGLVIPTLDFGCFGIGILRLGVSGIEERDDGNLLLGEIEDSRLGIKLAYGKTISGYNFGAAFTLEHHSLGTYKATSSPGLNLALGKQFELGSGTLNHIALSLVGSNLIKPQFSQNGTSISYPATAVAGVSVGINPGNKRDHKATLSASFTKIDWVDPKLAVGLEYNYQKLFSVRGGLRDGRLSAGVGVSKGSISFDYALVDRDLGSLHMFSLNAAFGKSTTQRQKLKADKREKHFNDLMSTRFSASNRTMISDLVKSGKLHIDNDDLTTASRDFDRALILARSNGIDTVEIYELANEATYQLDQKNHLDRLDRFVDSAQIKLAQKDYLAARYHANLALGEQPNSNIAQSILTQATTAIDDLSSKEQVINDRLQTTDSLLSYGQIDQAWSIISSLQPYADDYPRIETTSKRIALESWKSKATEAYKMRDDEIAIEMLDSALSLFPGHRWCLNLRNQAIERMNYSAPPVATVTVPMTEPLSKQLRKEVETTYKSAQSFFENGDLSKAIENWERVERLAPDFQSVRAYLVKGYKFVGVELYSQNKLREAVNIWKKALSLVPSNKEINSYVTRTETEIRKLQELSYVPK